MAKKYAAQSEWIRRALEEKRSSGKHAAGLAAALGLSKSQGTRIASGERPLKAAEVSVVAHYLGVEPPQAARDAGERYTDQMIDAGEGLHDDDRRFRAGEEGFVNVPVYDQMVSAGHGLVAIDAAPKNFVKFAETYLRSVSTNIRRLYVLEIRGDSNEPELKSGDHALVDPGRTNPARTGRYVLRVDDEVQVKLVSMNPATKLLTIKSDNPAYTTFSDIRPDDVHIIGQVIWIGRSLI